ncbi:MAG: hypothetical protein COX57_04140 [Alphaproteobacteria bacterium CG_4_10_14_0_2_um_filter_63_37]|nr:MAG: hypothetical protein AUJ55_01430 [Proteobacteria bacterium CG1_02_64_396]PJA25233.1 MAG: hypothetical protein COX57_04140 [Alphaproteobacteria bacterium CG_4_10_14_0_2_um_filter_63_37]
MNALFYLLLALACFYILFMLMHRMQHGMLKAKMSPEGLLRDKPLAKLRITVGMGGNVKDRKAIGGVILTKQHLAIHLMGRTFMMVERAKLASTVEIRAVEGGVEVDLQHGRQDLPVHKVVFLVPDPEGWVADLTR